MNRTKKELSGKEKRRLRFIREMRNQRDRMKQKSNINYPEKIRK